MTSMTNHVDIFPFTGGLDRSRAPGRADPATFYTLLNLRQQRAALGCLETTPRFYIASTVAQGTYWNGVSSATEPTTSALRFHQPCGLLGTVAITSYCISVFGTQCKALHRTAQPSTSGLTGGCMLVLTNSATASVNLGSTYDIVIDGAATFKWRVNGGAYTTLVAISVAGNTIDGGAATVYWLANTGFTLNDTWTFQRTDTVYSSVPGAQDRLYFVLINNELYFRDPSNKVMVFERDGQGAPYLRDVGYRDVYGHNIGMDAEHLFVYQTLTSRSIVQSSDLNDLDAFIATDVNEADQYDQRYTTHQAVDTNGLSVFNGHTLYGSHFLVTSTGFYRGDYAGLPIPYAFKLVTPISLNNVSGNVSALGQGVIYYYTQRELCSYDGARTVVLFDYTNFDVSGNAATWINYNFARHEVILSFETVGRLVVYSVLTQTVYMRAVDFETSMPSMSLATDGNLRLGLTSRRLLFEDTAYAETPLADETNGSAFATPTVCTQMFRQPAGEVKEIMGTYLGLTVQTTVAASYSIGSAIKASLRWYANDIGLIVGSGTTDVNAFWTSTAPTAQLSYPRVSYRYLALQIELTGTDSGKPPADVRLANIEPTVTVQHPNVRR